MRRVDRIIYSETAGPILISLIILTFVVFTREFGRLVQLLMDKNAGAGTVGHVMLLVLPPILTFTVPFAFLIGVLIGFSRLSSDSEIIALRAGGVSVVQMLGPVLKLASLVFILTGLLSFYLLPYGSWNLRMLRHEIMALPVHSELKPRVFYEDLPGMIIYVEDIDPAAGTWKGFLLSDLSEEGEKRLILARRGSSISEASARRVQLHLEDGTIYKTPAGQPENYTVTSFSTLDIPVKLGGEDTVVERPKRDEDKSLADLLADIRQGPPDARQLSLVELNRRIALPFSSFIFAVLGVTLGIRTPRGGRGHGFIVSFVLAFIYFVLFGTGSNLSENGVLPIAVGVWGTNVVMAGIALLTLRNANSETQFMIVPRGGRLLARLSLRLGSLTLTVRSAIDGTRRRLRTLMRRLPRLRAQLSSVIDRYILRIFSVYLLLSLFVCAALFYLFTFFELLDEIYRNHISFATLLEYFQYLLPQIILLLAPIAVLIATLVTFGSLERTAQLVALKAGGVSVYRVAVPAFALGFLISGVVFALGEYVAPYTNQRQDYLRNVIKGMPVRTVQPGSRWIFGEQNRLYNYSNFNPELNVFADLTIFHLDDENGSLLSHTVAQRAMWDRVSQLWILENGWQRDFPKEDFVVFTRLELRLPEKPQYFDEEVKTSSKMTYAELNRYIIDLQRGGFEVEYLKTELYKKVSFPIVSLIMGFLGLPFAVTLGRKGTLVGVALGVLLGITYWGTFGVFDVLGSSGMLAPALAAWGPNLLFGTGGALLLSLIRT